MPAFVIFAELYTELAKGKFCMQHVKFYLDFPVQVGTTHQNSIANGHGAQFKCFPLAFCNWHPKIHQKQTALTHPTPFIGAITPVTHLYLRPFISAPFHLGKVGQEADRSRWYHFNDATVSPVSESEIVSREAYLLFYERV